ncbi:C-type lectin domain-containing protein [Caenorhabditis elegans]|uniref:C-type lectin domain-containing protein n=1 Tax=Caenorhabditis elegans TaxID=6239 RepID=O45375_CAEEL|nr:C-type lectin domain-containing protein [Caenorhabditis elegans]CAB02971.1 C-type lectin domain-containing protein [Caenorhabditis elegans]|eukprot:NP_001252096.1 C-type LECtin [Caenorhabditis elegans]
MKPLHLLLLIIWVTITLGNFRNENPRKVIKIIKHVGSSSSYSSSSSEERSKRRHKNSRLTHSSRSRPTRTCPRDWITFERPQGRWCMKAFYGNMFQPEAEAKCNAVGARLSGLQNANERMTISYVLRGLIYQHGGGRYTAWLGGKRRARCPTGTSCARLDSIEWTDGHTTGTAGFSTGPRELDGYYLPQYGGVQQCLHMIVTPYSNTELGFADFVHESVDDEFCQATWVKAYVCGKLPS